jgi:multimeric flavodoxin WrbA
MDKTEQLAEKSLQRLNEIGVEVEKLRRIELAARNVVNAFSNSIDYDTWDKALDALELALKERS